MPLIQVKLIENVSTPAQKNQIVSKLTDAMVSIDRRSTSGQWGIGGQAVTTDTVDATLASFLVFGCF